MVVCDVSGKNPNVMFELGIRLAFDKPTIIVKDDKTTYSFDTAAIEHLEYPRDLRFGRIVEFKKSLAEKVRGTYKRASEDPNYTTFLKHFGKFTVAKLETSEVSKDTYIIEELKEIRATLAKREYQNREWLPFRLDWSRPRPKDIRGMEALEAVERLKAAVLEECTKHPEMRNVEMLMTKPEIRGAAVSAMNRGNAECPVSSDDIRQLLHMVLEMMPVQFAPER